jgi:hypothetical protein
MPIGDELLAIEPIHVFKFYSETATTNHRKCPAHQNQFKNTYVVCSPIDIEIEINKEQNWCDIVEPKTLPPEALNPRFMEEHESPYPVFSLRLNRFIFTPEDTSKNIYIEQLEPILEWDRAKNIRVVEGSFNISKWTRPLEATYEQQTKNITVKFKRGQPIYYVRFSTDDPEDIITLNKVDMNKELFDDAERCLGVKRFYPAQKLKTLYDLRTKFIESFKKQ